MILLLKTDKICPEKEIVILGTGFICKTIFTLIKETFYLKQ